VPHPVPAPDGLDTLVTTAQAAALAGVGPSAVRTWAHRGLLAASGLDERGRPLYRLRDVARAEQTTRRRARRRWHPCP